MSVVLTHYWTELSSQSRIHKSFTLLPSCDKGTACMLSLRKVYPVLVASGTWYHILVGRVYHYAAAAGAKVEYKQTSQQKTVSSWCISVQYFTFFMMYFHKNIYTKQKNVWLWSEWMECSILPRYLGFQATFISLIKSNTKKENEEMKPPSLPLAAVPEFITTSKGFAVTLSWSYFCQIVAPHKA